MDIKQTKYELQHLISGKSGASYDALIQAVAHHLGSGKRASPLAQEKHQNKAQEKASLIEFATRYNLMYDEISEEDFISSGAEQKVYIKDEHHVLKLNDAIYYASWEDYFHNLLLHNYFFSDTSYELMGFYLADPNLYAVVRQAFVRADSITNLDRLKKFMKNNGFENTRRHDFCHPRLGIILEDLHDENVLTYQGMLYFIDTVFYIDPDPFWLKN